MIKKFSKKLNSSFIKSSSVMLGGSTIAQVITILLSPIITRMYSPEDLGLFALYTAVVSILSIFFTGQYQHAIMLQKNRPSAYQLSLICLLISLSSFFIVLFLTLFIGIFLNDIGFVNQLGYYIFLIPISALFISLYHTLTSITSYEKKFKDIAVSNINLSLTNNLISITIGLKNITNQGLIIGHLSSYILSSIFLARALDLNNFKFKKLKALALLKRYKKFPLVTLPHSLFSTVSLHLPNMIIISFYNPALAGLYYLANRIAGIPISIINQALYNVVYQELSHTKNLWQTYISRILLIGGGALPLFLAIWLIAPKAFSFLFGNEWYQAGVYVQILTPLFYFKFISNLFTTSIYFLFERQGENFWFSFVITLFTATSLLLGALIDNLIFGLHLMVSMNILIILIKICRSVYFIMKD